MNLKAPQGIGSLGTASLTVAALLAFTLLVALSVAPPTISLGEMEKRIVADREECFLGESLNIRFIIVNPLDRDARLEPVREFTYGATMNGESWVNPVVHLDYPFGAVMEIRAGTNHTLFTEALTPTEPGELAVHAFGESLSVTVHPYKEASLTSPGVYLNITAPNKIEAGERFTAVFGIVNDNPYTVRLPAYSTFEVWYGFAGGDMLGEVVYIEWAPDACTVIEPRSQYVYKTVPFSPSKQSEYVLVFRADGHKTTHTVRIEP